MLLQLPLADPYFPRTSFRRSINDSTHCFHRLKLPLPDFPSGNFSPFYFTYNLPMDDFGRALLVYPCP